MHRPSSKTLLSQLPGKGADARTVHGRPERVAYNLVLKACATAGDPERAERLAVVRVGSWLRAVYRDMVAYVEPNGRTYSKMMEAYARVGAPFRRPL